MDEIFLSWLQENHPGAICQETLFTLYPEYRQHMVQGQIFELVPTRPEMEFPEVRQMHRHFILHIGPTNSGKTYRSLERLKLARKCLVRCVPDRNAWRKKEAVLWHLP